MDEENQIDDQVETPEEQSENTTIEPNPAEKTLDYAPEEEVPVNDSVDDSFNYPVESPETLVNDSAPEETPVEDQPIETETPEPVVEETNPQYQEDLSIDPNTENPGMGGGDESSLNPPQNASGNQNSKVFILGGITLLLLAILVGSIWFFFLRPQEPTPTPTPTTAQPTGITVTPSEMHLECRFGLCVEVPGTGTDTCSTSFDCEQSPLQPTDTPTPEVSESPSLLTPTITQSPTTGLNPTATIKPTNTPIPGSTSTPTATVKPTSTVTPTPLTDSLPISGTTTTTLLIGVLFAIMVGTGVVVLKKA